MVRLRRRRYSVWMWMRRRCSEGIHKSIHTIENVREVAIGEVESESIRKSIEDMQGWN